MSVVFSPDIKSLIPRRRSAARCGEDIRLKGNNGRSILLIHGLTGTPHEMRALATFFNRRGYTVLCPRLANHGAPLEVLKYSRWQDFYASVRDAYRSLREEDPEKEIFVSGLSMGALLSLLLADEFPAEIRAVSCLAPTLFYDGWNADFLKFLLPLVYRLPLKYMIYFKEELPYGVKNRVIQERIHSYYANASHLDVNGVAEHGYAHFPIALLYQLHLLVRHLEKRLPKITVPVQLIHAQDDDMASVKNSGHIYERIPTEKKEMVLLHNSYHVITADQERGVVAEKMEAFFNRLAYWPENGRAS